MTRKRLELTGFLMALIAIVLALWGGSAISAQDKYAVQVPGGLRSLSARDTKTGR